MGVMTKIKEQMIPLPAQVRHLIDWHDGDWVMLEVVDSHTLTVTRSKTWSRSVAEQKKQERLAHHRRKVQERHPAVKDEAYYESMTPLIEQVVHEFSAISDQAVEAYERYLEEAE